MLEGAKQEGTSDVAYSRNQPSVLEDDREPQRQSGARSGAQQTSNPKRIADFRRSQVCDSRPPRCTGQMTLETAQMMVLGRCSRQRVSRIGGANPLALSSGCRPSSSRKALHSMARNLELHQHVWLSSSCERLPAISMAGVPRRSELEPDCPIHQGDAETARRLRLRCVRANSAEQSGKQRRSPAGLEP